MAKRSALAVPVLPLRGVPAVNCTDESPIRLANSGWISVAQSNSLGESPGRSE
jgi:hypothetical protein